MKKTKKTISFAAMLAITASCMPPVAVNAAGTLVSCFPVNGTGKVDVVEDVVLTFDSNVSADNYSFSVTPEAAFSVKEDADDATVLTIDFNSELEFDTTYTVTLTVDDILIKQNYYLLDGAPTVNYEYFRRAGE